MSRLLVAFLTLLTPLLWAYQSPAGPVTREEGPRRTQVLDKLTKALATAPTAAAKFALITQVMKGESAVEVRRRILESATRVPGPECEAFLTALLTDEEDAGVRSQAATALGLVGSEKCLPALARCAESDRTT